MNNHITEIMPTDMPQWMWDAIDEGLLARRCMERVEKLEEESIKLSTYRFAIIFAYILGIITGVVIWV